MKMKRVLWTAAFLSSLSCVSIAAADLPEEYKMVISARIEPYYTVNIPADKEIAYGALRTDIGSVILKDALLEIDHVVRVEALCDGNLDNGEQKLPYMLCAGEERFLTADFEKEGEAVPLTVKIEEADWNRAAAGSYADTVTFRVSYVEK
ncbi:hypothetical protein BRYFOR_08281 [Marvinbryantia formatexigens DSM 14469]|uniref:Uncharacterized protein n=1 Tax=Marvinbryantia formatexigens DSM 14469 TaxID=478749 RepID=C6LI10_9FIRM|nr:hypothetical protein [Marvinbryantia formatexigens]EET59665.1 hypothetical protein BRYFOR_08281 [Marvinbryantia formatexigens DSM 14469]UWO26674.1 hypothetical protein NQ534_09535 [Marvinbryantia formatexigens DSM 14469]SDG44746.1 hypothetical protein SAMN05660368_02581 [Marvinbryantia formatexigens]